MPNVQMLGAMGGRGVCINLDELIDIGGSETGAKKVGVKKKTWGHAGVVKGVG